MPWKLMARIPTDCCYCSHPESDHSEIRCHGADCSDADGTLVDRCGCLEFAGDDE